MLPDDKDFQKNTAVLRQHEKARYMGEVHSCVKMTQQFSKS